MWDSLKHICIQNFMKQDVGSSKNDYSYGINNVLKGTNTYMIILLINCMVQSPKVAGSVIIQGALHPD